MKIIKERLVLYGFDDCISVFAESYVSLRNTKVLQLRELPSRNCCITNAFQWILGHFSAIRPQKSQSTTVFIRVFGLRIALYRNHVFPKEF
mgnify:CR=1 FL=1